MKKTLPVLLVLALVLTLVMLPAHADTEIIEYDEYVEDGAETLFGCWDSISADGEMLHDDGGAVDYCDSKDRLITGPYNVVSVIGWMASTVEIEAFGYMIDDGAPVLSEEYLHTTEDGVIAAGAAIGCDYASRFFIRVDVSGLTGVHKITFLIKLGDGCIVTLSASAHYDMWFNYASSADDVPATSAPTDDPDNPSGSSMGPVFLFNTDTLMDGEFFAGSKNSIEDAYFDSEKGCYVLVLSGDDDPYILLPFGTLSILEDQYTIDCAEYRILQIGVCFDAPTMGTSGQFFFQTDENTGIGEARDVLFKWNDTAEKQFVNINLGKNKYWEGFMIDSRLDPQNPPKSGGEMEFYYMAFFANEEAANEFGNKWLETGALDVPTPAPTPTKAPTEVPTQAPTPAPTENAPAVTDAPVSEPTKAPSGDEKDNTDAGNKTWLIVGIIAAVVVVAAVVAAVIAASKKKKKK
ncbi:MAG: PT domain-containing protein [Clostridia bacterium]|nr:PT domain-containing protein [Clostridia bacterium]